MSALFYEDFSIGQHLESGSYTLTQDALIAFAREFDPQPQHTDPALARTTVFGTLVASGWHTAGITMRLQLEAGLGRIEGGAMGAQIDKLVFHKPVHPGDTLRTEVDVMACRESRSRGDRGLLTLRTTTYNQDGTLVLEMTSTVFAPRRNAGPM
jgi:acyl dehydratase